MECARQGCDKEAIAGSNYCKGHFEFDKANVDKEDDDEGEGEGGEGGKTEAGECSSRFLPFCF